MVADAELVFAPRPRFDVEVIEDLDVIGQKADRREDDVLHARPREAFERGPEVGPQPFHARADSLTLERDRMRGETTALRSDGSNDVLGASHELALVRIAGAHHGTRKAVGSQDEGRPLALAPWDARERRQDS